jgi:hypothetical protein
MAGIRVWHRRQIACAIQIGHNVQGNGAAERAGSMEYGVPEFLEDVAGYGDVLDAYRGTTRVATRAGPVPLPQLDKGDAKAFLQGMYALVKVRPGIRIYRWFDDGEGRFLGRWWSPRRPGVEIDGLLLSSLHHRSRHELAIKHEWNYMNQVLEAELRPGTLVAVGRAAPQSDSAQALGGGAIQFLIPRTSTGGLVLKGTHARR